MIERLRLKPYRLPLKQIWQSARGALGERRGWLVIVEAGGTSGYGDCAPLPAAGTEAPERAAQVLRSCLRACRGMSLADLLTWLDDAATAAPAARSALEGAVLDLQARRDGRPLRRQLDPAARDSVAVNVALGALQDLTSDRVAAAAARGYSLFKVKVGLAEPAAELRQLAMLTPHLPPGGRFRLDANGAWQMREAAEFLGGLLRLPVESLEEPLKRPAAVAQLRALQQGVPFALALDESLANGGVGRFLDRPPVRRMVLKPAVLGGLLPTLEVARAAHVRGVEVVVTSVLESAAGLWSALQLAAALPQDGVHGLATGGWLARNLGRVPRPAQGRIALPAAPGSGFCPS